MKKFGSIVGFLAPVLVIGSLLAFVGYSLFLYQPSQHLACAQSALSQQVDIAVHVIRQWAGKEGQVYLSCPET